MSYAGHYEPNLGGVSSDDYMPPDYYNYSYDDDMMDISTPSSSSKKRKRQNYTPQLTVPISPNFSTSRRFKVDSDLLSSEQLKLRELQEKKEQLKLEREKAQVRKQQALYGAPMLPIRSEKMLTEPEEFRFATTARFGARSIPLETPPSVKKRKLSEDRALTITVPEPFHFLTDHRIRVKPSSNAMDGEEGTLDDSSSTASYSSNSMVTPSRTQNKKSQYAQSSPWVPLAQKMKQLENATPDHWKKEARPPSPHRPLVLTKAVEPILYTSMRSSIRPGVEPSPAKPVESRAFKALPLNRKILESSGDLGVMRVQKRPITQPISPKFHVDRLATRRPSAAELKAAEEKELAAKRQFKAAPINSSVMELEKKMGSAAKSRMSSNPRRSLTVPESPMLHTKSRSFTHTTKPEKPSETPKRSFKARPMPVGQPKMHVQVSQPTLTIPEPFDLATEQRSWMESIKRQKAADEEQKKLEEARQFKARPVPVVEPFRPLLELKVTDPEPFNFLGDTIHEAAQYEMKLKKKQESETRKAQTEFKARPIPLEDPLKFKQVNIEKRPLTDVTEFKLNSEQRSQDRKAFDGEQKKKETASKMIEERRAALEAERAKAEIKRLRQTLIHKALPVPKSVYVAPQPVKVSDRPLTEPKTPKFHTTTRRVVKPVH